MCEKENKLNLGCGYNYRSEYWNVDKTDKEFMVDYIIDLEKKLPFKDNQFKEVLAFHVLEHISRFEQLMREIHRICKDKARIHIRTPFYSSWGQFNDPTHVRFFTPFTFNYFNGTGFSYELGISKNMFKVNKVRLNFGVGKSRYLNFLFNPLLNLNHRFYCRFFAWIFPCAEIYYELEVKK